MKKTYYEKIDGKFVPVKEYDSDLAHSLPIGHHLISLQPGIRTTISNVNPAIVPLIAAATYAKSEICNSLMKSSDLRPGLALLTDEQKDAWNKLSLAFGEQNHRLEWPAFHEAVSAGIETLIKEADNMLSIPSVKNAYEEFMLIYKLAKDTQK